jgi:mannose-1-phosphate guanylyltransferase
MGPPFKDIEGAWQVRSFIARPAPAVAWRAQQNKSLWSTHIFMLKADLALAELRAVGRETSDPLLQSVQRIAETARFFVALGDEHWGSKEAGELVETLPAMSFEEAVFETTKLLAAIPTSIPFADLSTFAGYEQSVDADAKGNRLRGKTLAVQTRDTTVLADGEKLVVALGLEDVIVIDTEDATLVSTREGLKAMPSVIAALRSADAPEL